MQFKLKFINDSTRPVPTRLRLKYWIQKTVEYLETNKLMPELPHEGQNVIELSFVGAADIKELNLKFRNKDKVTDVLSFSFLEGEGFPGENVVGQIFLEPEIAHEQAVELGVSWKEEIEYLFVHALLHIFGFDHETLTDFDEMFAHQHKIMPGKKWEEMAGKIKKCSF